MFMFKLEHKNHGSATQDFGRQAHPPVFQGVFFHFPSFEERKSKLEDNQERMHEFELLLM